MQAQQQQVIDTKAEVDAKNLELEAFIKSEGFLALQEAEQLLMTRQLSIMQEYSRILGERIDAFPKCEGGVCPL
jgi:hypothetical protein